MVSPPPGPEVFFYFLFYALLIFYFSFSMTMMKAITMTTGTTTATAAAAAATAEVAAAAAARDTTRLELLVRFSSFYLFITTLIFILGPLSTSKWRRKQQQRNGSSNATSAAAATAEVAAAAAARDTTRLELLVRFSSIFFNYTNIYLKSIEHVETAAVAATAAGYHQHSSRHDTSRASGMFFIFIYHIILY
jgi:uncharacterized transporter YbjL